ncbi:MAG: TIGR03857 family LLM class F420-dependent oxidoreductase [Mycobacterium sp.]|nr:TIGR03857 family LLM class F420-dependent oxidoreductase [Mycobacterium sp.]TAM70249.1 MAG: TIGR03857 family LLM class F420-dependent oxidoreductase [Mycobacterium sp.]
MSGSSAVAQDLSAFVISGRVKSHLPDEVRYETSVRTPAQGISDGVDAERLGFRRVFLAERPELKEPGTILGGIAARTHRLGVATGIIAAGSRHPMLLASLGATMQAAYGARFTLGLGRGAPAYGHGGHLSYDALADVCTIVKRIWTGEQFEYNGAAGNLGRMGLKDIYEGPAPDIIVGNFGLSRAASMVAQTPAIDGILLPAMLTPLGVSRAARFIRDACERADRDPASVRILVELPTAPELTDEETRQIVHARAVTYLQPSVWGRSYELLNDWDPAILQRLREHPQFTGIDGVLADLNFHRVQLVEPSKMLPDEWMADAAAIGSIDDCVRKLQEFRDAGADEICTYGSTPAQNAKLIAAWQARKQSPVQVGGGQ